MKYVGLDNRYIFQPIAVESLVQYLYHTALFS